MRTILLSAVLCTAIGMNAQGLLGATERIELNAGGSVFPNTVLLFDGANDYEFSAGFFHCISPQWEIGISAGRASMFVPADILEVDVKSSEEFDIQGLMVRAEGRYYLRGSSHSTAPIGYYIRPAFQYQKMGNEIVAQVKEGTGSEANAYVTRTIEVQGTAMILGFGFGRQSFFGEHVSLDWTLTTGYPISTSVEANTDQDVFSKELVRTQMLGVRFGLGYQF